MRKVIFFQNNISRIATDTSDFLMRFQLYYRIADKLLRSESLELNLLLGGVERALSIPGIRVIKLSSSFFSQYLTLRGFLKEQRGQITLIAGDNHLSLLICRLAKARNPNVRLQISIHMSIGALLKPINILERTKLKFLLVNIRYIDSIRVVSRADLEHLKRVITDYRGEIFVAPVPIEIPQVVPTRKGLSVVGIVGRLHDERGVREYPAILKELRFSVPAIQVVLVGDGPRRNWLEDQLCGFEPKPEFTGAIKQSDLRGKWAQIHVLLSCAPSESYGMALREALVNGVFVVARKNETTELLQSQFPTMMRVFTNTTEAARSVSIFFNEVFSEKMIIEVRSVIQSEQDKNLSQLVKSWFV